MIRMQDRRCSGRPRHQVLAQRKKMPSCSSLERRQSGQTSETVQIMPIGTPLLGVVMMGAVCLVLAAAAVLAPSAAGH